MVETEEYFIVLICWQAPIMGSRLGGGGRQEELEQTLWNQMMHTLFFSDPFLGHKWNLCECELCHLSFEFLLPQWHQISDPDAQTFISEKHPPEWQGFAPSSWFSRALGISAHHCYYSWVISMFAMLWMLAIGLYPECSLLSLPCTHTTSHALKHYILSLKNDTNTLIINKMSVLKTSSEGTQKEKHQSFV